MPYVYAIVFNNGICKFGRTANPHKRLRSHVTSATHHGASPTVAFISQVTNDAKEEILVLEEASLALHQVSRESYKIKGLSDVAAVFDRRRLPFIVFQVTTQPYGLSVDAGSFEFDDDADGLGTSCLEVRRSIPNYGIRKQIALALMGAVSEMSIRGICDRVISRKTSHVEAALEDMVSEGSITETVDPRLTGSYRRLSIRYSSNAMTGKMYPQD